MPAFEVTPLSPCPFCSCDDIGTESTATDGSVWCRGCLAKIVRKHWQRDDRGQRDAIEAWNTRVPYVASRAFLQHIEV